MQGIHSTMQGIHRICRVFIDNAGYSFIRICGVFIHQNMQGIHQNNNSTVILPLHLIQEGQLSVTDESMCTMYWLTAKRTNATAQEKCELVN